jgi:hypothetical protein
MLSTSAASERVLTPASYVLLLQIGFVACFTSKLSDTVSSEIGKVSWLLVLQVTKLVTAKDVGQPLCCMQLEPAPACAFQYCSWPASTIWDILKGENLRQHHHHHPCLRC